MRRKNEEKKCKKIKESEYKCEISLRKILKFEEICEVK